MLTMKKILILLLVSGSVLTASAQVEQSTTTTTTTTTPTANAAMQPGHHEYYFYPSQNVYFDKSTGDYWYKESPTATTWTETTTLPSTITVENEKSYPIQYKGNDPWKNNTADLKKYKVKKNGTVKMKAKDDDDK
jgi:hypothetical protein